MKTIYLNVAFLLFSINQHAYINTRTHIHILQYFFYLFLFVSFFYWWIAYYEGCNPNQCRQNNLVSSNPVHPGAFVPAGM